jgi:hypothetical protein
LRAGDDRLYLVAQPPRPGRRAAGLMAVTRVPGLVAAQWLASAWRLLLAEHWLVMR